MSPDMSAVELAQALWLLLAAYGLALSVSWAGLPVLGQGAFVAVGGFGTALLGPGGAGLPLGLACVLAVVTAGLLGHLVALGASRLEGAYLALATWALAWLVHRALLSFPDLSGGAQGLVRPTPARLVSPLLGLEVVLTPAVHVVLAGVLCALAAARWCGSTAARPGSTWRRCARGRLWPPRSACRWPPAAGPC
jgi:branched-chain amino acid transport system permease protein